MTLTEKVLAKLDEEIDGITDMLGDIEQVVSPRLARESLKWMGFLTALRRQVAKHKDMGGLCEYCTPWRRYEGTVEYPCAFIKEVATDLGIGVGRNE